MIDSFPSSIFEVLRPSDGLRIRVDSYHMGRTYSGVGTKNLTAEFNSRMVLDGVRRYASDCIFGAGRPCFMPEFPASADPLPPFYFAVWASCNWAKGTLSSPEGTHLVVVGLFWAKEVVADAIREALQGVDWKGNAEDYNS